MKMKDVRIGLFDKSFLHFKEVEIDHIPNADNPTHLRVRCPPMFTADIPYHSVDFVVNNWNAVKQAMKENP